MSLGDFSTVIEMKDGLSTLPRVEELVSVMQKQKDCGLNMVDGATRQWSTIAGTLAATENTDCLNHFVKLNGPTFLNQWLLECQNSDKSVSENSIEGLITVLLTTIEKLPLDRDELILSGIGVTVEHLLGHRNANIQEKAKTLMEKWNYTRTISCDDLNNGDTSLNNEGTSLNNLPKSEADVNTTEEVHSTHPLLSISPGLGIDEASCEAEITCASPQLDTTKDVEKSMSEQLKHVTLSKPLGENATLGDVNAFCSSTISGSCPEKSITEESPGYRGTDNDQRDISVLREVSGGMEETEVEANMKGGSPSKSSREESCNGSSSSSDLSASSPCSSVEDSRGFMFPSGSPRAEEIDQMDNNSGLGLEYEEIDALEMARQVALEVEREVVDYREPFCSSPEVESGDSADIHSSPKDEQNQPLTDNIISNMLLVEKDPSDDASSPKNHEALVPEKTMPDPREHEQAPEPQGPAFKLDKKPLDFDLNDDVCTEGPNCSANPIPISTANLSAPKAVVATSRGALCLPIKPLQFNGEMGWKGSAATSAFRPASSCIKTCPGPSQKQNFLEIDLNVADTENDVAIDPLSVKQMPLSPNLPSVESSVEVSSRRAERLKLDLNLNRLGDEDISTNQSPYWRLHHQNGDQGLSSASSSSSQQHSMRDIDLNDNPCFIEACGSRNLDNSSSKASTTTYGSSKLNDPGITIMGSRLNDPGMSIMSSRLNDSSINIMGSRLNDPGITIMGSRMAVDRKDYINQAHQPFMGNGMHMETMTTTRPVLPYPHMPTFYGYNGHPVGPTMPIHPSYYGPPGIPYMVDPRGATFIPQMLGPVGLNGAHYARPPFIMSLTGAPSGMNGVMPSRSGWDLNSGIASIDGGSRDGGSFKQPFMHRHNGLMEESFKQPFTHGHMEEQARISSQSSSPSMSVKRKEPDCGWESYALGYKHMTSRQ